MPRGRHFGPSLTIRTGSGKLTGPEASGRPCSATGSAPASVAAISSAMASWLDCSLASEMITIGNRNSFAASTSGPTRIEPVP